jgi:PhoPQ-activated pathogenicity-related protein
MVVCPAYRCLFALGGVLALAWAVPARGDLNEYVKKPEPAFTWKLNGQRVTEQGTVYDLHFVSQVWQGIKWEHQLQVYQPKGVAPNATMLLYNTGGGANPGNMGFGMALAQRVKAPVAFLFHIPNQPLLGELKEDALIAETFVRFLNTKDENWPLLFPMVKGVVKAMDVLQAFSEKEWNQPVKQFVVSGASKRGWTAWLTGALGDPRVKAIAPLVIDVLNMRDQMPHQLEHFGRYSEMIKDYYERGLLPMPDTPEAKRLWMMVDPWLYRDKVTMPKLMILGNNDPYWTVDALNLYWGELKGDKWVMYVPNAGHNLQQVGPNGQRDFSRTLNGLAAYVRHYTIDNAMPKLTWKHEDAGGKLRLTVAATPAPTAARLWVAQAPTFDFRQAKWVEQPVTMKDGKIHGEVNPPTVGCLAFYAELDYEMDGMKYHLSTQIRVAGKTKPQSE